MNNTVDTVAQYVKTIGGQPLEYRLTYVTDKLNAAGIDLNTLNPGTEEQGTVNEVLGDADLNLVLWNGTTSRQDYHETATRLVQDVDADAPGAAYRAAGNLFGLALDIWGTNGVDNDDTPGGDLAAAVRTAVENDTDPDDLAALLAALSTY